MAYQVMSDTSAHTPSASSTPEPSDTLIGQFKSLRTVFWLASWMELIERFSYYGVRVMMRSLC